MRRQPDPDHRPGRTFCRAAWRYWTNVWPLACRAIASLNTLAEAIPDERLRRAALETLRDERGNLEGAAAFAVLAPREHRRALVEALVAFQAIYDYVDTLVELPEHADEQTNRRLHRALHDALAPDVAAEGETQDPYLEAMIRACRAALATLPAHATTSSHAREAVSRMAGYQARNHTIGDPQAALASWVASEQIAQRGYLWWEAAASAASSLVVFALLALAAHPDADDAEAAETVLDYEPAGALHVLLDSHADRAADAVSGDHSLIASYPDAITEASRLATIAAEARTRTRALRNGDIHQLILCAMTSFYLAAPTSPDTRLTTRQLARVFGTQARVATAVLRARRAAACLNSRMRAHADALNTSF